MMASRTHRPPTAKATHDQLVKPPTMTIGTPARAAIWNAPPMVPPMNADVLKNSAFATLTSRTRPEDCRVNSILPPPSPMRPAPPQRSPLPPQRRGRGTQHGPDSDRHYTAAAMASNPLLGPAEEPGQAASPETLEDPLAEALRLIDLARQLNLQV